MSDLLSMLAPGDLRTTGQSEVVVNLVKDKPHLFPQLIAGLTHLEPGVRMRSADALEKITRLQPELMQPFKRKLLSIAKQTTQQEVQWHLAQIFSYCEWTTHQAEQLMDILGIYFDTSASAIVKTFSLQAMSDIVANHPQYESLVKKRVAQAIAHGTPALISRAKKIQARLKL